MVSIGGISMGGAGKTPMVDHLAERLRETGHHPAILTRGYRRRSIETSHSGGGRRARAGQLHRR